MKESVLLNREMLLQRDELQIEKVELTKGYVYVREMTGKEKDTWEKSLMKQKPSGNKNRPIDYEVDIEGFRAKLAVVTVCDADGVLLFKPQDVQTLNSMMSAGNLDKIITVAQRLNRISEEDKEEILKNSEAVQENSSNSGSANS
jgi:hypothetical protein